MKREEGSGKRKAQSGQATTEMVLLVPLFLIFAIAIVKIFAIAVMVQKMELAMYYAGRRWMLESHKNYKYFVEWDQPVLAKDIEKNIKEYLGIGDEFREKLLGIRTQDIRLTIKPTIIYAILTLRVHARGQIPFRPDSEKDWEVIKYVPTRDRPIRWNIPSVQVDEEGGEAKVQPSK
ncbi:MAG: TadE family protein [Elusimicrobiota bacterium]